MRPTAAAATRASLTLALLLSVTAARAAAAPAAPPAAGAVRAPDAADVERFAGLWHGQPIMPADYVDNLMLFPDGRFYLDLHLDRTCVGSARGLAPDTVLGLVGRWEVERGRLVLHGAFQHEAGPGTCPCNDPAELEYESHGCWLELPATRLVATPGRELRPKHVRRAFAGEKSLGVPPLAGLTLKGGKGAAFAGRWFRLPGMGAPEYFADVVRVGGPELLAWYGCRRDGAAIRCDAPPASAPGAE